MTADRRLAVADGVELYARDWGLAPGNARVPFLLVHGLASNCRLWDGVAARLFELGHPVVAVDLRGHGQSDKPGHGYDFATLVADLVGVLDHLEWQRAVVAGQSMGGNLVLELAASAPARVVGAAGVDGGAIDLGRRWPVWEECAEAMAPPRIEGTPLRQFEDGVRRAHPDWSDEGVEAFLANFEVRPDGTIRPWLAFDRHMQVLRALWLHRPLAALARVACPVLLVMADTGDAWVDAKREEAERARAARAGVEVEWLSPADHDAHVQRPREVADLLHDRLGREVAGS